MDEFVQQVVVGEGGSGSVFLDGADADDGFVLAVWNDGDDSPAYESAVEATEESLAEAERRLTAAGLNVVRDSGEWLKMCRRWSRLS